MTPAAGDSIAMKSMSVRSFLDTNILVYSDDGTDQVKQQRAVDLIAEFDVAIPDLAIPDLADTLGAIDLHRLHGFSFWDARVLRAAAPVQV